MKKKKPSIHNFVIQIEEKNTGNVRSICGVPLYACVIQTRQQNQSGFMSQVLIERGAINTGTRGGATQSFCEATTTTMTTAATKSTAVDNQ